jgi:hypothetical protein
VKACMPHSVNHVVRLVTENRATHWKKSGKR